MDSVSPRSDDETFNPWSVVNLVFHHLADEGLHPVLGDRGDPRGPAAALLEAMGIRPEAQGNRQVMRDVLARLDDVRAALLEGTDAAGPPAESPHRVST